MAVYRHEADVDCALGRLPWTYPLPLPRAMGTCYPLPLDTVKCSHPLLVTACSRWTPLPPVMVSPTFLRPSPDTGSAAGNHRGPRPMDTGRVTRTRSFRPPGYRYRPRLPRNNRSRWLSHNAVLINCTPLIHRNSSSIMVTHNNLMAINKPMPSSNRPHQEVWLAISSNDSHPK